MYVWLVVHSAYVRGVEFEASMSSRVLFTNFVTVCQRILNFFSLSIIICVKLLTDFKIVVL